VNLIDAESRNERFGQAKAGRHAFRDDRDKDASPGVALPLPSPRSRTGYAPLGFTFHVPFQRQSHSRRHPHSQ